MTTVRVQEADTDLSRLLSQVESGDRVVIMRAGVPIAELSAVSPPAPGRVVFGTMVGQLEIDDDVFVALDDEVRAMWDPDLFPS